ncbi:hypothetical protein HYC85_006521 [Camellia sinensis]|uniref:Major facilitator superfamily (MFS) profile domain-containing protein n=1 Tax=Camellia sinensis TaxID=4442 RepID=A0A7J7HM70_CAMSI|nr:hypothetical protein HYC85_006521 [Camellia sinensis]
MAAFTPTKSLLHSSSSNPNSSCFFKTHFDSVSFKRTHLGFERKISTKWAQNGFSLERERIKRREKQRGGLEVKCTAEGIERGLLVGGRGQEGNLTAVPERFKVVALMACVMCLCNADRVVMSVAIVPLAAKHGWSSSFLGIVQSSFLWGYIFSSVVGGALVDKYGGKRVIAWGVALWSLATLLTPWAANHSTTSLLAVRAFFGLAEGVALPSMNTLLSRWFPSHERATAVGISMGGFHLGNVVGLVLTPIAMSSIGIAGPFIFFSCLGLLWLSTWAYGGYFVLLTWMPVYFKTVFNVNLKQAAWFSAVPWGTMALSGYAAGVTSDFLIKAGYPITLVRKIMQAIYWFHWARDIITLLELCQDTGGCIHFHHSSPELELFQPSWFLLNMQDIAPQSSGFLHGISNSIATLAAIMSTIGTGYFVQWLGSFQAFLTVTAALYFAATIFWNLHATGDRVF